MNAPVTRSVIEQRSPYPTMMEYLLGRAGVLRLQASLSAGRALLEHAVDPATLPSARPSDDGVRALEAHVQRLLPLVREAHDRHQARAALTRDTTLDALTRSFGLRPVEREIVEVLCAVAIMPGLVLPLHESVYLGQTHGRFNSPLVQLLAEDDLEAELAVLQALAAGNSLAASGLLEEPGMLHRCSGESLWPIDVRISGVALAGILGLGPLPFPRKETP